MVVHVAVARRRPARGGDDFILAKVEDKPRLGRVTWWAEQARREVGWVGWAGRQAKAGEWPGWLIWTGPKLGEEGKTNSEIDFQNTRILEIQIKEILVSKGIWRNSKNP
jgi:hypothetical protein